MVNNVNVESNGSNKKKAAVAGASALGIGALALLAVGTGANWNDSESVGAEFSGGKFNLQVATTTNEGGTWQWQDNTDTVNFADLVEGGNSHLGEPWAPGDSRLATFAVKLDENTTHGAEVTVEEFGDLLSGDEFTVTPVEETFSLDTDDVREFTVVFTANDSLDREEKLSGGWTFTAEQQTNNPGDL